jgi:hypothetical protein
MTMYLSNIARVYEVFRNWDKAVEFHLRAIDVAIGGGGERSLEVSAALEEVAYCYLAIGQEMEDADALNRDSFLYMTRSLNCRFLSFDMSFSL